MSERPRPDDTAYLAGLVRALDRPRYFSALFAPEPLRADLFALYGFALEIERIPDQVRDPTLGRIRLQWWRDSLADDGEIQGGGEAPALRGMRSVIRRHALPLAPLEALIEARDADLYSDPPATMAELEDLIGHTEGALFRLGVAISGPGGEELGEAARRAGLAYGLTRRLARFPADRAHGRVIVPKELLAREGLSPTDVFLPESSAGLQRAIVAIAHVAADSLEAVELGKIPRQALPVFLPLVAVKPLLSQIEGQDPATLNSNAALSDLAMLVRMGWAKLRGRTHQPRHRQ